MRELIDRDPRTSREILNGIRGPENGTDKTYSCDPDYESVDPQLFWYLEADISE